MEKKSNEATLVRPLQRSAESEPKLKPETSQESAEQPTENLTRKWLQWHLIITARAFTKAVALVFCFKGKITEFFFGDYTSCLPFIKISC